MKRVTQKNTMLRTNGSNAALIYCRVSTQKQEDEGTSLDSQAAACIAHAEKLGYTVARVTKEVYSGAELFDRPKLALDRADIRARKFSAVVVYAIDRLSRNVAHLAILSEECERAGTQLIFVTEDLDNTPEGKLLQSVKAYVAEVERQKIRERTQRGFKTKLQTGKVVFNGWTLYGYRANRSKGVWEIYEPEAAVLRRIFKMYAEGWGAHSICSTFNAEGIASPKASYRRGVHWSSSTIFRILENPSYIGEEYRWKIEKAKKYKHDHQRDKSEWIKMPDGLRPAIIPLDLWQQCQENMKAASAANARNKLRPLLLRGRIFCGECGWRMIPNRFTRGKYHYDKYRCGSHWRPFQTPCKGKGVSLALIDEWVWNNVKAVLLDPGIIERALDEFEQAGPDPQLTSDLEIARRELARKERGLQALLSSFRDAADDSTLWPHIEREIKQASREKQQLEITVIELEERVKEANRRVADLRQLNDYCALVRENLDRLTFEERTLALRALGVKVYANGEDAVGWNCELNIPVKSSDDVNALHVSQNC